MLAHTRCSTPSAAIATPNILRPHSGTRSRRRCIGGDYFNVRYACGWNLSARAAVDVLSRSKMDVPNALPTPITPFPSSGEPRIAQVIRYAREVNGIPFQYSAAPAFEPHLLDRHALMLRRPFPRIREQFLESTGTEECVRGPEFPDAEDEAAVRSRRSLR